jgi:plasmid stability protein
MPTRTAAPQTTDDREPVVKMMRLTLTAGEWRKLRVRAAEDEMSMQAWVAALVRRELGSKTRRGGT